MKVCYLMVDCTGEKKGKVPYKSPAGTVVFEIINNNLEVTIVIGQKTHKIYNDGKSIIPLGDLGLMEEEKDKMLKLSEEVWEMKHRLDRGTLKMKDGIYKKIKNACPICNGFGMVMVWESPTYENPEGGSDELCEKCMGTGEGIDSAGIERVVKIMRANRLFDCFSEAEQRRYAESIIRAYLDIEG